MNGFTRITSALLVALFAMSCGGDGGPGGVDLTRPVQLELDAPVPEQLSGFNLFTYDGAGGFTYNDRIVEFDLNTPLFTDYALKSRAVYVPEGETIQYEDNLVLEFPVGTIILKNFLVAADYRQPDQNITLVETRLLIRYPNGWQAFPYIWDADGQDATYSPGGEVRSVPFIDAEGDSRTATYLIPARNQCQLCHERQEDQFTAPEIAPLGPKARNLNRDYDYGGTTGVVNQLQHLADLGMLTGLPALASVDQAYRFDDVEANGPMTVLPEDLDQAARDYLDINCSSCHNPNGVQGVTSQLFLNHDNTDDFRLGVCKRPGSAGAGTGGLTFDIVPGNADESILVFRVETEEVGAMMPLVGRSVTHSHGAELLRAWVDAMPANDCTGSP